MRLKDRVAIVTGGQRGIGLAIAERFAREGAHVVIADIVDASDQAADLSNVGPHPARFVKADVGSDSDIQEMVNSTSDRHGRIDILINNAGVEFYKPVTTTTEEEWDRLMRVNLKGVYLCSRAAIPAMRNTGGVNVASELGLVGEANVAAYCAASPDPEGMRRGFEERMIVNRLGTPEEVAAAAVFLASDESAFMAGANLVVDGGWTTR